MITELTWKAEDVVRATHGQCLHEQNWSANDVAIDSNAVAPGHLFIALRGQTHDRHEDVAHAFSKGAVAAIVSCQPQAPSPMPLVYVEDTFRALCDLGRAGRARSDARVIAVAGSRKMESRSMLRFMLNEVGETYANNDGLDDRWGVPLALACLPKSALYGVFEIGIDTPAPGTLAQQVQPNVALMTAIETAHLDYFDPFDNESIGDRLFSGLTPGGMVVLDRDNVQFARLAMAAKAHGIRKILSFGSHSKAHARMLECITVADGTIVRAEILGQKINYHIGMPGSQIALHSLGALLTAITAGADRDACAAVLTHYRPSPKHSFIQNIMLRDGALTLIDETFDTGPAALRFAIRVLGQMQPLYNRRRILVLGDMASKEIFSPALCADLVRDIINARIDCIFCCGKTSALLYDSLPAKLRASHANSGIELASHIAKTVQAGDIITVKGASGTDMDVVIDALKALGETTAPAAKLAS